MQVYKQDSMLPSTPNTIYPDFPGWLLYLGKVRQHEAVGSKYATWMEASDALQKLYPIPKSHSEYVSVLEQDPRLPGKPNTYYDDYPGPDIFFKKTAKYNTLDEAMLAVTKLKPRPTRIREYRDVYKQDPRLRINPDKYPDFQGWTHFLTGTPKLLKYSNWQDAKEATKLLKPYPKSSKEYSKVCQQDSRLPGRPNTYYEDFPGWSVFLDRAEKYQFWQQAKDALCNLEPIPVTSREYRKCYMQDPRLPQRPRDFYGDDFPGWDDFLSREVPYETCKEAMDALQSLSPIPISHQTYLKVYKQDPRLVSHPAKYYEDYPGVDVFFGREVIDYFTKEEVVEYCQLHKVSSIKKYNEHKKIEPRLPRTISGIPGVKSISDIKYTSEWLADVPDEYTGWVVCAREWMSSVKRAIPNTKVIIKKFISDYLVNDLQVQDLHTFFSEETELPVLQDFIDSLPPSKRTIASKNKLNEYIDYCFKKVCCDVDPDTGEIIVE